MGRKKKYDGKDILLTLLQSADKIDDEVLRRLYEEHMNYSQKKSFVSDKHNYRIYESGGRFCTYITDPSKDNKRRAVRKSSEADLYEFLYEHYKELEKEDKRKEYLFRKCFEEYVERQRALGVSNNTVYKILKDGARFFTDDFMERDISTLDEDAVTIYLLSRTREMCLHRRAVGAFWSLLNGTLAVARRQKKIPNNPCDLVDIKRVFRASDHRPKRGYARTFSKEESAALYERLDASEACSSRACQLGLLTGLRVGELSALKWEDVIKGPDGDFSYLLIRNAEVFDRINGTHAVMSTKNHKERAVPLVREASDILRRTRKYTKDHSFPEADVYVFCSKHGRIHSHRISDQMRTVCVEMGLSARSVHAARRTFNSLLRSSGGCSPVLAASILGNSVQVNSAFYTYDISDFSEKEYAVKSSSAAGPLMRRKDSQAE